MSLQLFAHPFSSYCQKVLIAALGGRHAVRISQCSTSEHPENMEELKRHWPFGKFPLLVDDGAAGRRDDAASSSICRRTIPARTSGFPTARRAGGCASSTASSTSMS